jgi:hypothetical protein
VFLMRKRSEWKLHESWDAVAAAVDGVSLSGWRCIQAITPVSKLSMVGFQEPRFADGGKGDAFRSSTVFEIQLRVVTCG